MPPTCTATIPQKIVKTNTRFSLSLLLQLLDDLEGRSERAESRRQECVHVPNMPLPVRPRPALLRANVHEAEAKG